MLGNVSLCICLHLYECRIVALDCKKDSVCFRPIMMGNYNNELDNGSVLSLNPETVTDRFDCILRVFILTRMANIVLAMEAIMYTKNN